MSQVVWKQVLKEANAELHKEFYVELPHGSRIIRTGISPDTGAPAFWFACDPQATKTPRRFIVTFTGHEVDGSAQHMGMWWEGAYVFHLWELYPKFDPSLKPGHGG